MNVRKRAHPPEPALSSAQQWLLGLAAPLAELNRQRHDVLGGTPRGKPAAYWLLRDLGITTRAEMIESLERRLAAARASKRPAWELVRGAAWAGAGYRAFFIDADETWRFLMRAARIARGRYRSWKAYGADYVAGRQRFQGGRGKADDDEEAAVARLLEGDTSPWRLAPWDTPLPRATPPAVLPRRELLVGKGRDFATIGLALRAAAPGDVIRIGRGTYRETLKPKRDVELVGEGRVTVESDADHALFVDCVGVVARGITWISTCEDRSAIGVRDGGVLRMRACELRSRTHGLTVYDRLTMAFVEDVVVRNTGGIGMCVWGQGWLRADGVEVVSPRRSGISSEKDAMVVLERCRVSGAHEAGLLVEDGRAAVREASFVKSGWNGVQVSSGELTMKSVRVEGGGTGILARGGTTELEDVSIVSTEKNGLEIGGKARVTGVAIEVKGARGSGVLLAGKELALSRSRIESPGFDGITVIAGRARLDGVWIAGPKRAGVWLEGRGAAYARRLDVRGGRTGVCVQKEARLSLDESTIVESALGVATDGGEIAVEDTRVVGALLHGIQANGGAIRGGGLRVEGARSQPVLAANGGRVSLSSSDIEGEEEVNASGRSRIVLRKCRLRTRGVAAAAVHQSDMGMLDCEVLGGDNALEAVDGRARVERSLLRGKECALSASGKSEITIDGGALVGGSEWTVDLYGRARVSARDAELVAGKLGAARAARPAHWSEERCTTARRASFQPDLTDEIAPFTLVLHEGPEWSLIATDFQKVLGRRGAALAKRLGSRQSELNGHDLSGWIELVVAEDEVLAGRIAFDPEAGMFAASSNARDALVLLVARVREVLADDARFTASLERVDRDRD